MKRLSGYFIPDLICETVYEIPFESYFEKGIRAVAFDIDNTLVSYDTPVPPQEVKALLYSLKEKGIVSPEVAYIKIISGGKIDKSLIVFANDFTLSAVKMIALSGGQAIKSLTMKGRAKEKE